MSAAMVTKLNGIAAGATAITVDSALSSTSTNPVQNKAINTALGNKVDKVSGKGLSTNDYTTAEKTKLGKALTTDDKGVASGVATLDSNGLVPTTQLPSYVDDVVEGYLYSSKFYKESAHTTEITGETGKIYVDMSTNKTYRWSGSAFVVISETLALGETSSTAYRGDRGKTAYDHSQVTSGNPHNVTKADVGLGNVDNTSDANKSVSHAATSDSATTATKATQDESGNNIKSSYAAGISISGHTITLSNKSGTSLGTVTVPDNNTWTAMTGATASANGTVGYVNAAPPKDGYNTKYLRADGTWAVPVGTTYTFSTGLTNTSGTITNAGVRSIATGTANGTISVNTGGTTANVSVYGLKALAYKDSLTASDVGALASGGTAVAASKLATGQAIDGVTFNGEAAITHYGSCSTAAATAEKAVACTSYTLTTGSRIIVKFTVTNTAANPTLNVNSTGAKAINIVVLLLQQDT